LGVVEFWADSWQAGAPGLFDGLRRRVEALSELLQGLEALVGSGNISGRGADAMRAYIREVHVPIIKSLLVGVSTFQTAIGVYWDGYSHVDTDTNFRLVNDEFDAHITQLSGGIRQLEGFREDLKSIADGVSHLVSLGGAGAGAVDTVINEFEFMRLIARTQRDVWEAYEATDHGFSQVRELISELTYVVNNLDTLTVGQGRDYRPGSFDLTLETLGELTTPMVDYCEENQQIAAAGWEALFSGYVEDVEAEAERQRREQAGWDLLWDGLQILAGAVVTAVGVGLTPFTGGVSLGLTVLGGSLVVGGVNNAVNHVSIATSGQELNLVGLASERAGHWYDVHVAQPAIASGDKGLAFLAGLGSGAGQVVSEAAQMNVKQIGEGVYTLATDSQARSQLWGQVKTLVGKVGAGDTYVMGQITANLVPFTAATKPASLLRKTSSFDFAKPLKLATPHAATSALEWVKHTTSGSGMIIRDATTPIKNALTSMKHSLDDATKQLLPGLNGFKHALNQLGPTPLLAGPPTPLTHSLTHLTKQTPTGPTKPPQFSSSKPLNPTPRKPDVPDKKPDTPNKPDEMDESGVRPNPDWLDAQLAVEDLPDWRVKVLEGQQFNYQNYHRYPKNEVRLANRKVLDSYKPGKEIVSRKHTQLAEVRPATGKQYIDEILRKYPPDTGIVAGGELKGRMFLEVPVQSKAIPKEVLEHAASKEPPVFIRDVEGKVYE
jgi:hypothetical protein